MNIQQFERTSMFLIPLIYKTQWIRHSNFYFASSLFVNKINKMIWLFWFDIANCAVNLNDLG